MQSDEQPPTFRSKKEPVMKLSSQTWIILAAATLALSAQPVLAAGHAGGGNVSAPRSSSSRPATPHSNPVRNSGTVQRAAPAPGLTKSTVGGAGNNLNSVAAAPRRSGG